MKGPIARGTIKTSAVLAVRLVAQGCTLLLLARLLGPNEYGALAGVTALAMTLGTLSTFGTHLVLLAEVSRDSSTREEVLSFALTTTLIGGGTLFLIYIAAAHMILAPNGISLRVMVAIGIAELILQPFMTLPGGLLQGIGRTAGAQILLTLPLIIRLIVLGGIWIARPRAPLLAWSMGYLFSSAIALMFSVAISRAAWPPIRHWRLPKSSELKNAAGYAVLNLTAVSPNEIDKTLAVKVLLPSAAGLYAAATRVIGALTLPVIAMLLAAMPRLFREGEIHAARTSSLLIWMVVSTAIYSLTLDGILWLSAPLIDTVFGNHYRGIGELIRWLCIAVPGMSLRIAIGGILMSLRRPWTRAAFELGGLLALSVATLTLAPTYGLPGMAIALAISEWTMTIVGGTMLVMDRRKNTSAIM